MFCKRQLDKTHGLETETIVRLGESGLGSIFPESQCPYNAMFYDPGYLLESTRGFSWRVPGGPVSNGDSCGVYCGGPLGGLVVRWAVPWVIAWGSRGGPMGVPWGSHGGHVGVPRGIPWGS